MSVLSVHVAMAVAHHVVMFSGGWDSTLCLIRAIKTGRTVCAVFVEYDQPYLEHERRAVARIAGRLRFELAVERIGEAVGLDGKVFERRNERILGIARRYVTDKRGTIWFGSRCPLPVFDEYGDSNWWWAKQRQRQLGVRVRAPATLWPKCAVRWYCERNGVRETDVFSTEGWKYDER